ncbi:hypothetical protein B296_00043546 [Ensete ventricosum]|uniref:Uncharacterized protein n=1 Tax=Ensete ventricosum TaxID=4639 RepID=A0A426YCA7_ENSVE|nr:hypothetical protein B296_00043546 [Ensete ventricosum]
MPMPWEDPLPSRLGTERQRFPPKVRSGTSEVTTSRSVPNPRASILNLLEPDTLSFDSTDSLRAQLCQVNRRLDEVQMEFVKSKKKIRESPKGGSPFTPKI